MHVLQSGRGESTGEERLHFVGLGADDEERLATGDFVGEAHVGLGDLGEHVVPIGVGVRPGELNSALGRPLSGEHALRTVFLLLNIDGALHIFEVQFGGHAESGLRGEGF